MSITEALKIKTAAKAYLGAIAIAAQVALTYAPDHNTGWYTAVQGLVGALGVIGIFATPNKTAEAKQGVDGIVAQVQDLLAQLKDLVPAIVTPVTDQAVATSAPVLTTAEAMSQSTGGNVRTVDAMAPATPVLIPAPFTLPTTVEVPAPAPAPEPAPTADEKYAALAATGVVPPAAPVATPEPTQAP